MYRSKRLCRWDMLLGYGAVALMSDNEKSGWARASK